MPRDRVKTHKSKRGSKIVTVQGHTRTRKYGRGITSSCVHEVSMDDQGNRYINIRGKNYPYPDLPDNRISGLVSAKSAGRYYNKNIRGRYF